MLIKNILVFGAAICSISFAKAQADSALWHQEFNDVKNAMQQTTGQNATLYHLLGNKLDSLAITNPGNAEVWYYLGCAIDKYNTSSGEEIPSSSLELAKKASACFSNCLDLCNGRYTGSVLLFDPHTKILSVWGAQAFRYLNAGKKDSAVWCLQQAYRHHGINSIVTNYFQQVLDECTSNSYLFTNGDLYLYYMAYIQYVLKYRSDVRCVSLNFLNTQWYPAMLKNATIFSLNISNDSLGKIQNIDWKEQNIVLNNNSAIKGDSVVSWTLKPTNGDYLLRSDIILKSFLEQNSFTENVFFVSDVPENMRLYLNTKNYAQLRGLTLKIVPQKNANDLLFLQNRLAQLDEISPDDSAYDYNKDNVQVLNNYRFAYTAAANIALQQNQQQTAQAILSSEEGKYPESVLPFYADATKNWFDNFKQKVMGVVVNK